ncbi:MAG TPA: translocation/assembly module TamB domain-containing protein [Gemmatimonadales bacterium]|nr:translocation/assembly module TamB domain-containing protein [Gemmatimonadales bacterium]
MSAPEPTTPPEATAPAPPPRRRHHRLRWIFGILGALVLVVLGLLWYGLSSDRVAQALIRRALASAGGTVQIGRVGGRLRGPLLLWNVRVKEPAYTATIDSVRLEWTPTGLLRREVRIDRLHVSGVHVVLPDSTPRDTTTPKKPDLPMTVILGDVVADRISVDAPGDVKVRDGWVQLNGRAKDYRLSAHGTVSAPALREAVALRGVGRGNLERIALDSAFADLLRGHVATHGVVGWYPKIHWKLDLVAQGLEPRLAMADTTAWPGAIGAVARTAGYLDSIGPIGEVTVDSLFGALRRQPLRGAADVHFHGKQYRVPKLDAGWGSARALAAGTVSDSAMALRFHLAVADLRTALPGARGALTLAGTASGPPKAARVRADVTGRNLAYGTNALARLTGRADVTLAERGRNAVRLTGDRARVGTQVIDHLVLALTGTRGDHHVSAEASGTHARADLALDGGLQGKTWRGRVSDVVVQGDTVGTWRLVEPAPLQAAATATSLGQLCLRSGGAQLCAGGTWRDLRNWRIDSRVDSLPLATAMAFASLWRPAPAAGPAPAAEPAPAPAPAAPAPVDSIVVDTTRLGYAPGGLAPQRGAAPTAPAPPESARVTPRPSVTGFLNAVLAASAVRGRPDGRLRLALDRGELLYHVQPDTGPKRVLLDTAGVEAWAAPDGVHATARLTLHGLDRSPVANLAGELALPGYTELGRALRTQAVTARLDGAIVNLGFLRAFYPQADSLDGKIALTTRVDGTVGAPRVDGRLAVTDLAAWLGAGRVARGSVDATLVSTVRSDRRLDLDFRVVPRGWLYDYQLDLRPHRIAVDSGALRVTVNDAGLHGLLALGISDTARTRLASFQATLAVPEYHSTDQRLATLPFTLTADAAIPQLVFARLWAPGFDSLAGRLALHAGVEGTMQAPQVRGTLRLDSLFARLPYGSLLTGALAGDLTARVARDSMLTADLTVAPRGFALAHFENGVERRVVFDTTGLVLRVGADGLHGTLDLGITDPRGGRIGALAGRLALPGYRRWGAALGPQPLTARFDGRVSDLSFAEALAPQVDSLAGRLTLAASLTGTVDTPRVTGGMQLQDVAARLPLYGVVVHDVQLTAQGDSAGAIRLDGRLRSGPGALAVTGASPLAPTAAAPGRIRVQGDSFEVMRTPEAHVLVSPDMSVTVAGNRLDAQGALDVPYAHIELTEIPQTAVAPSPDIVFIGDTLAEPASAWRISGRVRVTLGDSVTFKGFNFTAKLGGQVLAMEQPGNPPTASGAIVIEEGHYQAYGQNLTIRNGRIRFAGGPAEDPGLDIRATRMSSDTATGDSTVAGLQISGTLKNPRVDIFSDPPMSQSRALQYIVLGHPLGDTTQTGPQGSLMEKAVNAAGLRGGNLLASAVGRNLGLSNTQVVTTNGDLHSASLVAGKYLSPRLYVSYGLGLFDPISRLRLRYVLSRRWTLQAERGSETGADVMYRIESGGTPEQKRKPTPPAAPARAAAAR